MKKILCFGDSNTYGFNPKNGLRFDENIRWTSLLSVLLKNEFEIIEDGLNNRTCFAENSSGENYTGYMAIQKILSKDIDYLLLFVGINDLQKVYNSVLLEFEKGLEKIVSIIKKIAPICK